MKIIILGTAYPYRGGLASFNERMAEELVSLGNEVVIYTFTLQYPNFLFPGKSQFSEDSKPEHLNIRERINSINPLNWIRAGIEVRKEKPDIIISKFWIPFMGPSLGTIIRLGRIKSTKVISIIDNIIPHEKRIGDKFLADYFVKSVDEFVVMSRSVEEEIKLFTKTKIVKYLPHPVYDNYGDIVTKKVARNYLGISEDYNYILFFGFIRDYKGLDLLLRAMADSRIISRKIKCIIAGEYYGNKYKYNSLIDELNIRDELILKTEFISNEDVKYYFCSSDLVVQPYKTATQSGISQLAYHFEKPMVVTNVGGLPEIVNHGESGYVVDVDVKAISDAIIDFYDNKKEISFVSAARKRKEDFSWDNFIAKMME